MDENGGSFYGPASTSCAVKDGHSVVVEYRSSEVEAAADALIQLRTGIAAQGSTPHRDWGILKLAFQMGDAGCINNAVDIC